MSAHWVCQPAHNMEQLDVLAMALGLMSWRNYDPVFTWQSFIDVQYLHGSLSLVV